MWCDELVWCIWQGLGGEGGAELHSEELVLPGTVEEMKEFADYASSSAHYQLSCFFPEVRVHLPSKHFLETLYNRYVCMDNGITMATGCHVMMP